MPLKLEPAAGLYSPAQFAKNLRAIQAARGLSLGQFAKQLGLPKTTLHNVLASGDTSLYTASCIAKRLNLPLDALLGDDLTDRRLDVFQHLLQGLDWFSALPPEGQDTIRAHLDGILDVMAPPERQN